LLKIEVLDSAVEFLARRIHVLELFIGTLLIVYVLIDGGEFALDPCEVLSHMEHSEVVVDEGEPLVILLVL